MADYYYVQPQPSYNSGSGSDAFFFLFIILLVLLVQGWLAFSMYNPPPPSNQPQAIRYSNFC